MPRIYINEDAEGVRLAEEQERFSQLAPTTLSASADSMKRCRCFNRCSIQVCPLDLNIASRYTMRGEKICPFILDYLEGKEVPFMREIKNTRKTWERKIGKSILREKLKSRARLRRYNHQKPTFQGVPLGVTTRKGKMIPI